MLKFRPENKSTEGDDAAQVFGYFENDDRPITRYQLEVTRSNLLEAAAREKDPNKRNEMTVQLSKLDQAIKNFDAIGEAEMEVTFRRLEVLREQSREARREASEFEEHCLFIASMMISRYMGMNPHTSPIRLYEGDPEMRLFQTHCKPYASQLFKALSVEQARQQYDEIFNAFDQYRYDWQEFPFTPKPPLALQRQVDHWRQQAKARAA